MRPASDSGALRRLLPRLSGERGYTISELLVVMIILGVIVGSLTSVFVSASRAEVDMNLRFQAQQEARLALGQLRREGHCAKALAMTSNSHVAFTFGAYCRSGATADFTVTWCTSGSGSRWVLRRVDGVVAAGSCTGGKVVADYLTQEIVFPAYSPNTETRRATLSVRFIVDVDPANAMRVYRLEDEIVLRNSPRS